jgi:dipeptidyl aminopeptidase/acylaminoacyl peptidase
VVGICGAARVLLKNVQQVTITISRREQKVYDEGMHKKIKVELAIMAGAIIVIGCGVRSAQAFDVKYDEAVRLDTANGTTTVAITSSGTGTSTYYECPLGGSGCGTALAKLPAVYPELQGENYDVSPDRNTFLTIDTDAASGQPVYTVYTVQGGKLISQGILPFHMNASNIALSNTMTAAFLTDHDLIAVVDLRTGQILHVVSSPSADTFYLTFSPRGRYLAYYTQSSIMSGERTFTLQDLITGCTYTWGEPTEERDLLVEANSVFSFAPDDSRLIYLDDTSGFNSVYSIDLPPLQTFQEFANIGRPVVKDDGSMVAEAVFATPTSFFYTANTVAAPYIWSLYRYDYATGRSAKIDDQVSWYAPLRNLGSFISYQTVGLHAGEAMLATLDGTGTTTIETPNTTPTIAMGTPVKFAGGDGILYLPPGYTTSTQSSSTPPLIVWLHGGPYEELSDGYNASPVYGRFDKMLEDLRQAGFMVLKMDYPGSFGYGTAYFRSLIGNVGKSDVAAVAAGTQLIQKNYHPSATYVMGISYGGYLSLETVADDPSLYNGVIAISAVTDWSTLFADDGDISELYFNGYPSAANEALYDQADIFGKLDQFAGKKVMVAYGGSDTNVQPQQSIDFIRSLTMLGTPVTTVEYPDENHVFNNDTNLANFESKIFSFLGAVEPTSSTP